MIYLTASATRDDLESVKSGSPRVWRQIRRFNPPVQLALAAAHQVASESRDPSRAALVSLAPCQTGSAQLYDLGRDFVRRGLGSVDGNFRMNPVLTLHAVDNLALSSFSIAYSNRAYCLGLGGAAGQAWCGLEAILERLEEGSEEEAMLLAGDQSHAGADARVQGLSLLFSRQPRPHSGWGRLIALRGLSRKPVDERPSVNPHAAIGLNRWLAALELRAQNGVDAQGSLFRYRVPARHGDGQEQIIVETEMS